MPGNNVNLEVLKPTHAAELFDLLQAEAIYSCIPEDPPDTLADLESRYRFIIRGPGSTSPEQWFNWVLREQESRQAVGMLQATVVTIKKTAFIAYVLFPEQWGKGYARQGVELMMSCLIRQSSVQKFIAEIDSRNQRSLRLVKRLGFEHTGTEPTDEGEDHIYTKRWS